MRVLLVEDHLPFATYIGDDLHRTHGHDVVVVGDPLLARAELTKSSFDVVVADLSYDPIITRFNRRQADRGLTLTGGLIHSGLTVVRDAHPTPAVIWTSAEPNRRLHIFFAQEVLKVKAFCGKGGVDGARTLHTAITMAVAGQPYVDPEIQLFLPPRGAATLAQTILSEPESKRAMWRALALGAHSREEIAKLSGNTERYVGSQIPKLFDDLVAFDSGLSQRRRSFQPRQKLSDVVRYASHNREFFLDEAVQVLFP